MLMCREFAQKAWNFLNDSLRTTMCVRFRPEVMAAAGIFLASRTLGIALPENPPWWEVFDATKQRILAKTLHLFTTATNHCVSSLM